MNQRIELRQFKWVMDRTSAIRAITNVQGEGLTVGKETYEKIDKIVEKGIYIADGNEGSKFEDYNYMCFLDKLRFEDIISYKTFDFDAEESAEMWRKSAERTTKAYEWLAKQSDEDKEMIKILMDSVSVVIG